MADIHVTLLSRAALRKQGVEVVCPLCEQSTVAGRCDLSQAFTERRVRRELVDLSEDAWVLTEAGKDALAQWRSEHPEAAEEPSLYQLWKADQESK